MVIKRKYSLFSILFVVGVGFVASGMVWGALSPDREGDENWVESHIAIDGQDGEYIYMEIALDGLHDFGSLGDTLACQSTADCPRWSAWLWDRVNLETIQWAGASYNTEDDLHQGMTFTVVPPAVPQMVLEIVALSENNEVITRRTVAIIDWTTSTAAEPQPIQELILEEIATSTPESVDITATSTQALVETTETIIVEPEIIFGEQIATPEGSIMAADEATTTDTQAEPIIEETPQTASILDSINTHIETPAETESISEITLEPVASETTSIETPESEPIPEVAPESTQTTTTGE